MQLPSGLDESLLVDENGNEIGSEFETPARDPDATLSSINLPLEPVEKKDNAESEKEIRRNDEEIQLERQALRE